MTSGHAENARLAEHAPRGALIPLAPTTTENQRQTILFDDQELEEIAQRSSLILRDSLTPFLICRTMRAMFFTWTPYSRVNGGYGANCLEAQLIDSCGRVGGLAYF